MRWPVTASLADLKAGEPGSTLLPPSGETRHCRRLEAAGGSAALQWEPGTGSYEATLGWQAVVLSGGTHRARESLQRQFRKQAEVPELLADGLLFIRKSQN